MTKNWHNWKWRTPTTPALFLETVIRNDYRNLSTGMATSEVSREQSVLATFRYRNPITCFFSYLSGKYEWKCAGFIPNQLFLGQYTGYGSLSETHSIYRIRGRDVLISARFNL